MDNIWLHRFAVALAAATLLLVGAGGLVTSHGAGMAVPDWPTSYGYNMFLFPVSYWVGGIFYEHTHRLYASLIGFLTIILAIWLWLKDGRAWVRWMGALALCTVILQGILGGLRVTLFKDQLGIFHATLAQLFLVLVGSIALFTSPWWHQSLERGQHATGLGNIRYLVLVSTLLILFQLILGAAMRHQHAGLAVPDFPLAYGKLWPPMDEASLAVMNQQRMDIRDYGPVTAVQIGLHMAHRAGAMLVLISVGCCAWQLSRRRQSELRRFGACWLGLIVLQGFLGAATVWSGKAADIATLHVVVGAMSLLMGSLLSLMSFRCSIRLEQHRPAAPLIAASVEGRVPSACRTASP